MTISSGKTSRAKNEASAQPCVPDVRRALRRTVLGYHELTPEATEYRYALSCALFEEHLRLMNHLQDHSSGYESPVVLSFDDGHVSNYTIALPLLEKYRCKAVFFVIAGRIGEHKDFMTWPQLRELVSLGHLVESHSWSHKFLTGCSDSELDEEVGGSRKRIEDGLGVSVEALSVPHGRWDERTLRACAKTGYRNVYTSDPWSSFRSAASVEITGRLIVQQSLTAERLLNWLTMGPAEACLHRGKYAIKQSARRMLGDKIYYRLWSRLAGWNGEEDTSVNGRQ